jgi:hypothetical protein
MKPVRQVIGLVAIRSSECRCQLPSQHFIAMRNDLATLLRQRAARRVSLPALDAISGTVSR